MAEDTLAALEDKIGYRFENRMLLERAMTHSSTGDPHNYERLEFLGDRVLGLVMAHTLFDAFMGESEGGLAKRHSALVQGRALSVIAAKNKLGEHIIMAPSERDAGGAENDNILSDALEALLGAVYLDGGLEPAQTLILKFWGDDIHTLTEAPQDPKTELQEWVQARSLPLPDYAIVSQTGPDHAPVFVVQVSVQGKEPVSAEGSSRRQAEKTAAQIMLRQLKGISQ
jgi:ribonuclease-3